jgi:hypothetical protein
MNGDQDQPAPRPRQARQQQPRRVTARHPQYTSAEVFGMLNCVQQVLPIDGPDWQEVYRLHIVNFPNTGRDAIKLKRKFQLLYRSPNKMMGQY